MDALIMAAGRGSRLGPETDRTPKSLIDLGGSSALQWQLTVLSSREVRRVVIVTGYRRGAIEETAKLVAGRFGLDVVFAWNPFWAITNVLASAWFARDRLSTSFVYTHADTIFHPSILDDLLKREGDAVLPVDIRPCEPEQMKARIDEGRVTNLSKELSDGEAAGEFLGVALFRDPLIPVLREAMDVLMESGAYGAYFEEAINWAIRERGLQVEVVNTAGRPWTEIDFPEDLEQARSIFPRITP